MPVTDLQVERWLREDLGHHDVTNDVPGETSGRLVAKEAGVAAGLDAAEAVFEYLGVDAAARVGAGDRVEPGETVLTCEGDAQSVLRGERVAVNVAGHASGVATKTRAAVDAAREVNDSVAVAGTRKTTPGLRGVEKRAVAAGGGDTHRLDLSHMVMVKENHAAELGLEEAIARFREEASFATKVEAEVEDPADAARAAAAGADVVLLDNMTPEETATAVDRLREADADALAEASGGIAVGDVPAYARTGVDVISMGALTHSAPSLDYSFRTG
ncbi:carboxylating nicotinate-nucleotide diphosphorylase [Halostella sp. JP-L12]|uniref:carboxylating nicotinate-nucleotide diphosphorylase n=1 Tax=Halostella TaxID=1843185 RepID=UPI000EF7CC57|nr:MULTISPECIES: carboxylating nicotinate-nucleotide diphosphorylase [Halostella]NHN46990.1 carboxylating nicotinate-nucleotide diphosphorylase [Halostella sp. JP-L12]